MAKSVDPDQSLKVWTPKRNSCIILKFKNYGYDTVMPPKIADRLTNLVDL